MAARWYKCLGRCGQCLLVGFLLYSTFVALSATIYTPEIGTSPVGGSDYQLVDQSDSPFMARIGSMRSALLALATSSLAAGQNSTSPTATTNSIITATIDGTASTFSNAFTVPAAADIGPNLLPNVKDPHAKQAQDVCPGYTASDVEKTTNGFTALLSLAGEPVGTLLINLH